MKKNIEDFEDIKLLVNTFYVKVKRDEKIGFIFNDVAQVNWENHLPKMYSFWETILLGKVSFRGNPILKHLILNNKIKLTDEHFKQWIFLWNETIDELFTGKLAENAKSKAELIKNLMVAKIAQSNSGNEQNGFKIVAES